MSESKACFLNIVSMVIYGTIGVFRKFIPLPSSAVALARAGIGAVFLLLFLCIRRRRLDLPAIRRNLRFLLPSGVLLGFNWILLFEAYNYTSVAVATLCYYMAPVILILLSPLLFGERLSGRKLLCVAVALVGMVLVSGVLSSGGGSMKGIILGLVAALFYASIVVLNKQLQGIDGLDRTVVQLLISAVVLIPYVLVTENVSAFSLDGPALFMLAVICIVHTGIAYALYFSTMSFLGAQSLALLSYIDPVVAILCSAFLLGEQILPSAILGAVLIIGALTTSELQPSK